MVKSPRRSAVLPSAELSELHDDVFSVVVHELGGLSSALALRADALRGVLPDADARALRSLAEQARDLSRLLRLLRGPVGEGMLAPSREVSLDSWWKLIAPLAAHALPRGVRLHSTFQVSSMPPGCATALTYLLLLAVRDLPPQLIRHHDGITVRIQHDADDHVTCALDVSLMSDDPDPPMRRTRWTRYATRLARREQIALEWWTQRGPTWCWSCTFQSVRSQ
jgi:hypothetical protein